MTIEQSDILFIVFCMAATGWIGYLFGTLKELDGWERGYEDAKRIFRSKCKECGQ